jgi:hypothetical protein
MTQVIRTNGDYKIQATSNGAVITLDTPTVVVTGNLTVEGTRTDVNVNNLYIEDNIININNGESPTHSGITLTYAGVEINRGSANNVAVLYNETSSAWEFVEKTTAGYNGTNSKIKIRSIITDATISGGDLELIGDHIGVATVPTLESPNDYTTQILNRDRDDDIPNKGYVDYAIANREPQSSVGSGDTTIVALDKDVLNDAVSVSSIQLTVDGQHNVYVYADKTFIHDLEFRSNIIENVNSIGNIRLLTNGTGKLETNYAIQLDQILTASQPAPVTDTTVVYSKTPGVADSGIYFVNTTKRDELISKNKALVFSMLF